MNTSPEFYSWKGMDTRCCNPNHRYFHRYGGRGITICKEWHRSNPNAFRNFVRDMGNRPIGKCLDRINNDGNYTPENCRWVTMTEQHRNKCNNHQVTAFGETKLLAEWAEDKRCVVEKSTIGKRIRRGWTPEQAISAPSTFIQEVSECEHCRQIIVRVRKWQRFCSDSCAYHARSKYKAMA